MFAPLLHLFFSASLSRPATISMLVFPMSSVLYHISDFPPRAAAVLITGGWMAASTSYHFFFGYFQGGMCGLFAGRAFSGWWWKRLVGQACSGVSGIKGVECSCIVQSVSQAYFL